MSAMYKYHMNMWADASWYAPASRSAQTTAAHTEILDTAIEAVSFLSLGVWGAVRVIGPQAQS